MPPWRETPAGRLVWQLCIWGPAAAWVGLVTVLSHQSRPPVPLHIPDWVIHGAEFGVLALLLCRAVWHAGHRATPATAALVIGACALFGALDELHQGFVPGRDMSLKDGLADAAGAAVAGSADLLIRRRFAARRHSGGRDRRTETADVVLVGRAGCHLCDEAETVLREVLPGFRSSLTKADVQEDPRLSAYADQVPVVLINGRKAFKHRIDPARLRRRLEPWRKEGVA